jgi:hypothetical protein
VPSFTEVDIEGNERTAVRIAIYKRLPSDFIANNESAHEVIAA